MRALTTRVRPALSRRDLMLVANATLLLLALALQLALYNRGGHSSLSDIPRVLLHRGIKPGSLPYIDRMLEYPVGSGLLLYAATVIAPGPFGTFAVTALMSAALCLAITVVLERRFGARAWRWALGFPLIYAYQNWDIFAVAALLGSLLAFERHRDRLAGSFAGVGAAIKLFPAVFVPPAMALRWRDGDRRGAIRLGTWAAGVFAVINLPVMLGNPAGWFWTFRFQGKRAATWGSASKYLFRALGLSTHGATAAQLGNTVSAVALLVGVGWLTWRTLSTRIGAAEVAAAGVAIFLLVNKVYSPTYDVWLLAFFVLLPLARRLYLAYCAVVAAVFAVVYGYFHGFGSVGVVHAVLPFLVIVRTVVLVAVVVHATRPEPVDTPGVHTTQPSPERALTRSAA